MKIYQDTDLWEYLSQTEKTVVMYGMGNGADKILAICCRYGIEVADFFASDGFVRGHSFHGKRVLSYSEVKEKYGAESIIVLLSSRGPRPFRQGGRRVRNVRPRRARMRRYPL